MCTLYVAPLVSLHITLYAHKLQDANITRTYLICIAYYCNLVPRPFPPPLFDWKQNTGGGNGLGTRLSYWVSCPINYWRWEWPGNKAAILLGILSDQLLAVGMAWEQGYPTGYPVPDFIWRVSEEKKPPQLRD